MAGWSGMRQESKEGAGLAPATVRLLRGGGAASYDDT